MSAPGSLVVRGATLLHLDPPGVEQADVLVRGGRIAQISAELDPAEDAPELDAAGRWLMPGLVCGHTHLYSALACGMPAHPEAPTGFADMLANVWWRLDRALDRDSVEVSALVGGLAALRAGVTTLVDHHASPSFIEGSLEVLDGALDRLGLRRILCYEVTDRGGAAEAAAGLRAHEALLGADGRGRRAVMIGAHASFTLSEASLLRCGAMAREAGVGLHIHVAESAEDAALTGEDPVARLERTGALAPGSLLAHCVHLDDDAFRRAADAGAWLSHQPRSNMNNAVGHAPLPRFGPRTVLGTDGIGADLFAELQAGFFRGNEAGVGWPPDRWLRALVAGADFAGERLGLSLGRLEVGAAADFAVLAPQPGPPLTADNLAAAFVFRLGAGAVRDVVVDGRVVLRNREPVGLEPLALDARAGDAARRLWERMA
jgi:cytosine/adenosine deaminase-related metal-dependent hydrolase